MGTDADTPPLVRHNIINTLISCVAHGLHSIAAVCARCSDTIAGTNVDRIGGVSKMISSCELASLGRGMVCTRWYWKTETRSSQSLGYCLESDNRKAVGQPKKGCNSTSQRVSGQPDVGIRIKFCDV